MSSVLKTLITTRAFEGLGLMAQVKDLIDRGLSPTKGELGFRV